MKRNVLEWRFDPASEARLPQITGRNIRVIVMRSQGYTSSLAAASLQDLGLLNATDLDGGFQAGPRSAFWPVATSSDHSSLLLRNTFLVPLRSYRLR